MPLSINIKTINRKKLQKEIDVINQRFRIALKNSHIVIFAQDLNLRYTWVYNPNKNFNTEDVIGKTDMDLLPAEDAIILTNIKQNVLKTGKPVRKQVRNTIKGNQKFFDLTIEPIKSKDGIIEGVLCASSDITSLENSNRELKKSREHFISLADSIAEIFFTLNKNFKISYWGKTLARYSGISYNEALGKKFGELYTDFSSKRLRCLFRKVIKTNSLMRTNYKYNNQIYDLNIYPFLDGVTVLAYNKSETRNINKKYAEVKEKEFKNISQVLHNDIGQYISALSLRCAELETKVRMKIPVALSDINEMHNICISAGESLHELNKSILWKAGCGTYCRDTILCLCRDTENAYHIKIKANITDHCLPESTFEREHILRFIQEALTNAAKHSKQKIVELLIKNCLEYITYSISDKGCGFCLNAKKTGFGLKLMQFNADEIAGVLNIKSGCKGTTVTLTVTC